MGYPSKMNRLKLQIRRLERGADSHEAGNFSGMLPYQNQVNAVFRGLPRVVTLRLPLSMLNRDVFVDT
jgi:hypothetical protein